MCTLVISCFIPIIFCEIGWVLSHNADLRDLTSAENGTMRSTQLHISNHLVMFMQAADKQENACGWIRSEGDHFLNGAQPCLLEDGGAKCVFEAHEYYSAWTMEPGLLALKKFLQVYTGWQPMARPQDDCRMVEHTLATEI